MDMLHWGCHPGSVVSIMVQDLLTSAGNSILRITTFTKNKRMRLYSKDGFPIIGFTINVYEAI